MLSDWVAITEVCGFDSRQIIIFIIIYLLYTYVILFLY